MNLDCPNGVEKSLTALSHNPFGDHGDCDPVWWHHERDPCRRFSTLPYGGTLAIWHGGHHQQTKEIFPKIGKPR